MTTINKKTIIHKSSIVNKPNLIGAGTKIWHFCHIMEGAQIGQNCSLGQNVFIGSEVIIGNNVKLQNNVSIYNGVVLEDNVFCGPSMVFTNDINPRTKYPKNGLYKKTLVKEGASLGANCTIICGNTIGKHAMIGCGAVVTKDVPDYTIAYGIPAIVKGWMCECGEKLQFKNKKATCDKCKRQYTKKINKVNQDK